jgi:hypothetical protein
VKKIVLCEERHTLVYILKCAHTCHTHTHTHTHNTHTLFLSNTHADRIEYMLHARFASGQLAHAHTDEDDVVAEGQKVRIHTHTHTYTHIHTHMYIYIYIYIYRERERDQAPIRKMQILFFFNTELFERCVHLRSRAREGRPFSCSAP